MPLSVRWKDRNSWDSSIYPEEYNIVYIRDTDFELLSQQRSCIRIVSIMVFLLVFGPVLMLMHAHNTLLSSLHRFRRKHTSSHESSHHQVIKKNLILHNNNLSNIPLLLLSSVPGVFVSYFALYLHLCQCLHKLPSGPIHALANYIFLKNT